MSQVFCKTGLFSLISLLSILSFACNNSGNGKTADDEVAARVNGVPIKLTEIDSQLEQQFKGQQVKLSPADLASARLQILDNLIIQQVLYQRAQAENLLPKDDEVTQELLRLKRESGLSEENYQKQLKELGMTEEDLRNNVQKRLAIDKLRRQAFNKLPNPSDKEIEEYYNTNKEQFVLGRGIMLSDIIVDPRDNGAKNDAIGEEQAKQKVDRIYAQLKAQGFDFATVARAESEDPDSALRSGDLGFISEDVAKEQLGEEWTAKFFAMQEGQIAEPRRDKAGRWHIFKLTGKKTEPEELKLEDPAVRKRISDTLLEQRQQIINSALLFTALNEAKIENFIARRILENPANFGSLRPSSLLSGATSSQPPQQGQQQPQPTNPETKQAQQPAKK